MNFCCIADEDTVRGFKLTGIEGTAVHTAGEAAIALSRAASDPACGIVILTEPLASGVRDEVDRLRLTSARPLVAVIPGPAGPMAGRRDLRSVVQAAVGIRVGAGESV